METAILLKQEDILDAIKKSFDDEGLEINLKDEEIITKVSDICRKGEPIPNDSHVFPVI